ncbi:hypothetical protein BW716_33550 [[Flexibacter] sp. ATCC 35208]|nr:hypothetical protein BW716_33550 [[Flexibacter] sp. ATCC 35208]
MLLSLQIFIIAKAQVNIYASPAGNDLNKGTVASPFKTLTTAIQKSLQYKGKDDFILLRAGTY